MRYKSIEKECPICKKLFLVYPYQVKDGGGKFCSKECHNNSMVKIVKCNCKTCGKEIYKNPSTIKKNIFCSNKCYGISRCGEKRPEIGKMFTGRKHTQESKDKMSKVQFKTGMYNNCGYIMILQKKHPRADRDGYVKRPRFIIEKFLNRYLKSTETVHHINKIRNDDRIQNLMVFKNISSHQRFHKNPSNVLPHEIIFNGLNPLHHPI